MGDVIKFKKPKPVKPARQVPPTLKKVAVALGIVIFFAAVWTYFQYFGA